ncbi:hypothetical protein M5D96_000755 [Drosophila gunungcola]|uniref:Arrestin C-terminal-like domain-containing protein n=1 Tax=Drosophila gunungcola TaxID=103775 RepID=A0A9Q0BUN9_9MUSC|nr:hypothetical protein M5D96_000755 [Drosophila gunungcola]
MVISVVLQIKGYAETHWTDTEHDPEDQSNGDSFNGHVDYLATKAYLHGSSSSIEVVIEPGTSKHRFACQLPTTCPSSFEGTFGQIRYLVNVRFVRPWKFDQNFSRCFTVLKVMDLNSQSLMLRVPTQVESQRTFCCFPCRSAPLSMCLSLPRGGFVPGQTVAVEIMVSNDSGVPVEDITVKLAMVVIYYSQPPCADTNKDHFVMVLKTGEGVSSKCRKQLTFDLKVPATPPTCFDLCSIIQIGYQVEAEARVKGCHGSQSLHMPITIGSVPLTKVPVQARTEKTFGVWPFRSDPLTLELNLPQTGFVPGQTVPVNVLVGNESKIRVYEVKVALAMMITYYSDLSSGVNSERKSVAKLKADGVMRNSRKMYDFQLPIPSTPPSCFHLCRIIKIGYQIEVVAKVKGMHVNGTLVLPVTICGVPIAPPMGQYIPDSSTDQSTLTLIEGEGACAPAAPPYPWSEGSVPSPPSYAEAMHMHPDPEKPRQGQPEPRDLVEKSYSPLYPVYKLPPQTEAKKDKEEQK